MHKLKKSLIVIFGLAALGGLAGPVQAGPDSAKAEHFIRERIARSMMMFNEVDPSHATIARRVRDELNENFDINTIAAYALGPLRKELSPDQRQRYLTEFKDWVSETVVRFVIGLREEMPTASPAILTLTGTTPVGADQILVHSRFKQSRAETAKVDWRLRLKGDRFMILDIIVLGVSQAEVFRSQFASLIRRQNRDIEGLIAELKQRNAHLVSE